MSLRCVQPHDSAAEWFQDYMLDRQEAIQRFTRAAQCVAVAADMHSLSEAMASMRATETDLWAIAQFWPEAVRIRERLPTPPIGAQMTPEQLEVIQRCFASERLP